MLHIVHVLLMCMHAHVLETVLETLVELEFHKRTNGIDVCFGNCN